MTPLSRLWRFEGLTVGVRLRLVFACVLLFMLAGSAVSLWFFQGLRDRTRKIAEAELRLTAVVRVNNGLLTLMSRLHRAADSRRSEFFEAEATGLLTAFRKDSAGAAAAFDKISPASGGESIIVDSFKQMLAELPARIATLKQLAREQDWNALHARLTDQVDHTDDVAEALVREADARLLKAQQDLSNEIVEVERRAMISLAVAGILAILAAALLGMITTQSITAPLARLNEAARALARGDFAHRVSLSGSNELANLGRALDHTAQELSRLYAQLRLSEARFRSLIENGSDLILVVSASGGILYASPSSTRMLGHSPETLTGLPLWEILSPGDVSAARLIVGGKHPSPASNQPFELHFRRHDGSVRLLEGIVTNLLSDHAVGGILINARDITERRQTEQALRRSEQQLRLITDSLPVLISYVNRDHRYLFSNLHHEQWFHQSRQQLTGARVEEVMGGEAYRSFHEGIDTALDGRVVTYETTLSHESLGERHVRTILVPDFDERNDVRGFVSLMEDITADKAAEAALRASEERLQHLLARENEGRRTAELLNQIGRVLSAELDENKLAQSVIDISTQLVGAQFGALFQSDGPQPILSAYSGGSRDSVERMMSLAMTPLWPLPGGRAAIRAAAVQQHPVYIEQVAPVDRQNGYAPVSSYLAVSIVSRTGDVLGTLLFGHASPGVFSESSEGLITAICAQAAIALDNARLFKQLNNANVALQESNHALQRANEDLNVFAFSASHDLQEPLRNISLYSQMLQRRHRGQLDPESDEFLIYIVQGAARMSELIRDLLAYIQASNIHTQGGIVTPAALAVQNTLLALQTAVAASDAKIIYDDLPEVAVEPVHFQQLLQNLISNAIKYRSEQPPEIRITACDAGAYWEFSIKDNGLGIEPQYQKQIFKPFKRLHGRGKYPGTGIGLAICQKIVARYGGRIWIESEPGEGSDFKFTVPKRPGS
jgi:PAS domain S-box-containing protein